MTRVAIRVSVLLAALVSMIAAADDEAKWRQTLESGNQAIKDGDYLRAREFYSAARQLTETMPPDHPWRAFSLAAMGNLELVIGNERQAEQSLLEARRILIENKLQAIPQYAQVLADLGVIKANRERWTEAEPLFNESIALFPPGSLLRAAVVSHLGSLYTAQDRMAEALPLFNQAIEIQRKGLPESRTALLYSLEALGSGWFAQGRYQQAEVSLREAWQLSHDLPPDHPGRADTATHLGSVLVMEGKSDPALPLLKSAQSIYQRTLGGHARQLGAVLTMLARMDTSEKHYAMAEEKLQRVLNIFEQCYPPGHIAIAFAQANLAQVYIDQRKYQQARPLLERALLLIRATYPGTEPTTAAVIYEQARLEAGLQDFVQADSHFRESIGSYEQAADPHDPRLGSMLHTYAAFLKMVHRNSEAKPLEARAKSIFAFRNQ